jgi:hypothetical protein
MFIPVGLRHLLDVYKLVNDSKYSHSEAFREVATRGRITGTAVRMACMRDIGVTTQELTYYLDADNSELFKAHLSKRYPAQQDFVCQFIDGVVRKENNPT